MTSTSIPGLQSPDFTVKTVCVKVLCKLYSSYNYYLGMPMVWVQAPRNICTIWVGIRVSES
jgi:hypothetical protein